MKTFFDRIFMDSNKLQEEGILYPIKLEYYKTINVEENVEAKYGVEIVKTKFENGQEEVEKNTIKNITNKMEDVDKILTVLRDNEVTPIVMQDVLEDIYTNI